MNEIFLQWAKEHKEELVERGITSEIPDLSKEIVEKKLQNPCQVVYYYSSTHVGFVSVWRTGIMDLEMVNIDTEKMEYYRHFEDIKELSLDELLENLFRKMV